MIVVRVELWSAVNGSRAELARMHIANDGEATVTNRRLGTYTGETFVGRSTADLDKGRVSKRGRVENWRRLDFHVWNLVAAMLASMGYSKGRPRDREQETLEADRDLWQEVAAEAGAPAVGEADAAALREQIKDAFYKAFAPRTAATLPLSAMGCDFRDKLDTAADAVMALVKGGDA